MNKILIALIAAASLAACDQQDHTIVTGGHKDTAPPTNTAGVVLPPSITVSHTYRCKNNSLVYIDWMSDGAARVKANPNERATTIAVGGDAPQLTGDASGETVTYKGQSCSRQVG